MKAGLSEGPKTVNKTKGKTWQRPKNSPKRRDATTTVTIPDRLSGAEAVKPQRAP